MYELDRIKEYVPKIEAELQKKDNEISKLKNNDFGKLQQFKSYDWSEYKGIRETQESYWGIKRRPYSSPDEAQKQLDCVYDKIKVVVANNEKVSQHNTAMLDKLLALCQSMGMESTTRQRKPRTRNTYETVNAEWWNKIRAAIPTWHYSARSPAEQYNIYKKEIDDWRNQIVKDKLLEEKAEADRLAERKKNVNLGYLITKYGLDEDVHEDDILDDILNRCKYLKLAHYMQANRNDWNDGPDYAECGLNGFTTANEVDNLIYDEISNLIANWDGDGRCFRDCKWNYSVLFDMVDTDLREDYNKALTLVKQEV